MLKAEHKLYPLALRLVAEGKAVMVDGRTVLSGIEDGNAKRPAVLLAPDPLGQEIDLEHLARITP